MRKGLQPVLRFLILPGTIVNRREHQIQVVRGRGFGSHNHRSAGFGRKRYGAKMPSRYVSLQILFDSRDGLSVDFLHGGLRGAVLQLRHQILELGRIVRAQQEHVDQGLSLQTVLHAGARGVQNCLQRDLRVDCQSAALFDRQFPDRPHHRSHLLHGREHIPQTLIEPSGQAQAQLSDGELPISSRGRLQRFGARAADDDQVPIRAGLEKSRGGFIGTIGCVFGVGLEADDVGWFLASHTGPSRLKDESADLLQIAQGVAGSGFASVRVHFKIFGAFANPPGLAERSTGSQQGIENEFF